MPPTPEPAAPQQDHTNRLGPRLRALRLAQSLTLEHLATTCGLTRGYLSLVERDLKTPSVAALLRMTEALNTDIGALFNGRQAAMRDYVLHRHQPGHAGPQAIPIAPGRAGKTMEPFIIAPSTKAIERFTHSGEELLVVLRGEVMVRLGDDELVLGLNDSLYFTASIPHTLRSIGPVQAELLVVVGRPDQKPAK
jgi:transcriptional regulator with XRE-family HTH domain